MQLRPYQKEAVTAGLEVLGTGGNPVLQLATGTGKSLIIAALADHYRQKQKKVWVLTHVQQLVSQNAKTFTSFTGVEPAIVCAGLNRKELDGVVTFGTIQSVRAPALTGVINSPNLIIIDEAHRVPHNDGEHGTYEQLLAHFDNANRVAMTATPWRMDNGIIYGNGDEFWFDTLAYRYDVPRAVKEGYLCPLVGVETEVQLDLTDVAISGDYVQKEAGAVETDEWLYSVARSVRTLAANRNRIAVYCPTIESAQRTVKVITDITKWGCSLLTSTMSAEQRAQEIINFQNGINKVLCSVDMITTGFDYPPLDCIVCLRPTLSSSLWVQIQGRGTRLHPSKKNCLVLDYVGNLQRLGGVDMYETFYREKKGKAVSEQPAVPTPIKKKERRVLPGVTSLVPIDPMTGEDAREGSTLTVKVHEVRGIVINTRRSPDPILLVMYLTTTPENARIEAALFIDSEHPNNQAMKFFADRRLAVTLPCPANKLTWQIRGARLPSHVVVKKSGIYWNVLQEIFEEQS
jgi:DNA repair protein RadD